MALKKLDHRFEQDDPLSAADWNELVDSSVMFAGAWPTDHVDGIHASARFEKGSVLLRWMDGQWVVETSSNVTASIEPRIVGGSAQNASRYLRINTSVPFPSKDHWNVIAVGDGAWPFFELEANKTARSTRIIIPSEPDFDQNFGLRPTTISCIVVGRLN